MESVKEQIFTDWELIVTEDGSNDGTREAVNRIAQEVSQNVVYQRHPKNRGLSATRNSAIKASQGRIIALLDADDYWDPNHLAAAAEIYEKEADVVAHSGSLLFDNNTGIILEIRDPDSSKEDDFIMSLYRYTFIVQPSSSFIPQEIISRVGLFDEDYKRCEDMDYWFRTARAGFKFVYTGINSCRYRKHSDALTGEGGEMAMSMAYVYKKHLDWSLIPKANRIETTSKMFAVAGQMFFKQNPDRAKQLYQNGWRINRKRIDYILFSIACSFYGLLCRTQHSITRP